MTSGTPRNESDMSFPLSQSYACELVDQRENTFWDILISYGSNMVMLSSIIMHTDLAIRIGADIRTRTSCFSYP